MDQLKRSHFLQELSGRVHLSHFDAVASIKPELAQSTRSAPRAALTGVAGVASHPDSPPS
jgi:hypothetical protein